MIELNLLFLGQNSTFVKNELSKKKLNWILKLVLNLVLKLVLKQILKLVLKLVFETSWMVWWLKGQRGKMGVKCPKEKNGGNEHEPSSDHAARGC